MPENLLPEEEILLRKQPSRELLEILRELMGRKWAEKFTARPEERFNMLMDAATVVVARTGRMEKGYEFVQLVVTAMAGDEADL